MLFGFKLQKLSKSNMKHKYGKPSTYRMEDSLEGKLNLVQLLKDKNQVPANRKAVLVPIATINPIYL